MIEGRLVEGSGCGHLDECFCERNALRAEVASLTERLRVDDRDNAAVAATILVKDNLRELLAERDATIAGLVAALEWVRRWAPLAHRTTLEVVEAALARAGEILPNPPAFACGHPWDDSALTANGGDGCKLCPDARAGEVKRG